jgi:superfamily II DNA or RNA helicase
MKQLKPLYNEVEFINGSVSSAKRSEIVERVLQCKTKIVICHTATASLGVDFTSTNVIVYFSPTFSNIYYLQSLDRVRRLSSVGKGFSKYLIYHIIADIIEKKIYEGLQDKTANQAQLFKLIRQGLEEEELIL